MGRGRISDVFFFGEEYLTEDCMSEYNKHFFPDDNFCMTVSTVEEVTLPTVLSAAGDIFLDSRWRTDMRMLVDLRSVVNLKNASAEVTQLVAASMTNKFGKYLGNSRRAILTSSPVVFETLSLWVGLRDDGEHLAVFDDLDAALEWLGVEKLERFGLH